MVGNENGSVLRLYERYASSGSTLNYKDLLAGQNLIQTDYSQVFSDALKAAGKSISGVGTIDDIYQAGDKLFFKTSYWGGSWDKITNKYKQENHCFLFSQDINTDASVSYAGELTSISKYPSNIVEANNIYCWWESDDELFNS